MATNFDEADMIVVGNFCNGIVTNEGKCFGNLRNTNECNLKGTWGSQDGGISFSSIDESPWDGRINHEHNKFNSTMGKMIPDAKCSTSTDLHPIATDRAIDIFI